MFELSLDSLFEILKKGQKDVLCLFAPNYEDRSMLGVEKFLNYYFNHRKDLSFKFGLLSLQSSIKRNEVLEVLKEKNTEGVKGFLKRETLYADTIPYPDGFSSQYVSNFLEKSLGQVVAPYLVVCDISSLPRRIILTLLNNFKTYFAEGKLDHVFFLYSWAERYPRQHYPSEVGQFLAVKKEDQLYKYISTQRKVQLALFIGYQGFDAKQLIETLPVRKELHLFIFMNREDPFHSLEVMRINEEVIFSVSSSNVHYYTTLVSGNQKLLDWANTCIIEDNCGYLIAPFGPKPLSISTWIATNKLNQRTHAHELTGAFVDITLLSGHQYSTSYSIGYKNISVFVLDNMNL